MVPAHTCRYALQAGSPGLVKIFLRPWFNYTSSVFVRQWSPKTLHNKKPAHPRSFRVSRLCIFLIIKQKLIAKIAFFSASFSGQISRQAALHTAHPHSRQRISALLQAPVDQLAAFQTDDILHHFLAGHLGAHLACALALGHNAPQNAGIIKIQAAARQNENLSRQGNLKKLKIYKRRKL